MSIDFFNIADDGGWVPLSFDRSNPLHLSIDGRPLASGDFDPGVVLDGVLEISAKIPRSFNMVGLRCQPNVTIPRVHHNLRQLVIVLGGQLTLNYADDNVDDEADNNIDGEKRAGPGQFVVIDAGTAYSMTAGPDGATYIETWPKPAATLETYWHPDTAEVAL